MTDVEFMSAWQRMCNYQKDCSKCEAQKVCSEITFPSIYNAYDIKELIDIISSWAEANPIKTLQNIFLENYPNALTNENGILCICPRLINDAIRCINNCNECKKNYWNQEVE